jgi:hypothetical protein
VLGFLKVRSCCCCCCCCCCCFVNHMRLLVARLPTHCVMCAPGDSRFLVASVTAGVVMLLCSGMQSVDLMLLCCCCCCRCVLCACRLTCCCSGCLR